MSGSIELLNNKNSETGRIVLLIDHDQQGILPSISDIWQDSGSFVLGLPRDKSLGANSAYKRFTILWDYKFAISPSGSAGGVNVADALVTQFSGSRLVADSYYKRIFHYVHYSANSSAITS